MLIAVTMKPAKKAKATTSFFCVFIWRVKLR